jgi:hypothetical protein
LRHLTSRGSLDCCWNSYLESLGRTWYLHLAIRSAVYSVTDRDKMIN